MSEEVEKERKRESLEERLLEYAAACIRSAERLPGSTAGRHVCGQLIRAGTAPMAHHGEAQGGESADDFIHNMSIALKELRESERWLQLIVRVPMLEDVGPLTKILKESDELQRTFYASIQTARLKSKRRPPL
ncbi:four helix bundle protein [Luteolibacter yonseiensis]|uniref:Four helix bundle protein n=1 Tax=Luteolibacter yonseiensis TaxID=1144680 RepID=A0A934VCD7_9BACT|nr:four helix bundle protein [Luteolibacter yonseiensis]MBK1816861.1 four helix bundle protein [Luteolibacter yonseiensis]